MEVGPRSRRYNTCNGSFKGKCKFMWEPHFHEVNETLFTLFYTTESGLKPGSTPQPHATARRLTLRAALGGAADWPGGAGELVPPPSGEAAAPSSAPDPRASAPVAASSTASCRPPAPRRGGSWKATACQRITSRGSAHGGTRRARSRPRAELSSVGRWEYTPRRTTTPAISASVSVSGGSRRLCAMVAFCRVPPPPPPPLPPPPPPPL